MSETSADAQILELMMADLGKTDKMPALQKAYLQSLISSARTEISREGITIDDTSVDDLVTISMYASYLYRKRAADDNGMPRMLRYRLNNRLFAEKGSTDDAS